MTGKWNLGRLAAIGGLAMTTGLLTGLGPVHADELADLRANQQLLQQRIDQLAQAQAQAGVTGPPAPLTGGAGGGAAMTLGYKAAPGIPVGGGSFPRSFLIPGTDTSIRVGGFVDFTTLYFINGGGNVNGSNYGSNAGQNGTLARSAADRGLCPGRSGGGFVASQNNAHPSRNNGIWEFSVQQSRLDVETRTPTSLGRGAHLLRLRLGRMRQFQLPRPAAGRWRQSASAPPFCLRHIGWVPRRPGVVELLRRRCRYRIDGFRRRDRFDRRSAHPAGAIHGSGPIWQRFLGIGGKPLDRRDNPRRTAIIGFCGERHWNLDHAGRRRNRSDLQRHSLHRCRHSPSQPDNNQGPQPLHSPPIGRSPGGMSTWPVSFAFRRSMMAGISTKPSARLAAISRATCTLIGGDTIRTIFCGALSSATQSASTPAVV